MFTEIVTVGTSNGVQIYDLRRGTKLAQGLGVSVSGRYGLDFCDTWMAAVDAKKPLCHIYTLNRGDTSQKFAFPFPEEISCVHVLNRGAYLAAGARSGRIMIWATASGRMLRSWDAHYGAVTSLCSGEGVLVSGGEDAAVHIWMLSQAMDHFAARDAAAMPVVSLMGHTLAVTTLHMAGPGILAGRGRLYTASKDHTCKQWRVRIGHNREDYVGSAELLSTLLYPGIVNDIAVDKGETRVFAATGAGLFQTNLFAYGKSSPQSGTEHAEVGLVALGGTGDVVLSKHNFRYPTTYKNIAALCLNFDGTLLVSASESGDTRVWDTASRQCLRTISDKHLGSGVVQLSSRLAPPQLGGPRASVHTGLLRPETIVEQPVPHKISEISFTPLQRLVQGAESRTSTAFEALIKKKLVDATRDMAQFEASLEDSTPYGGQTSRADIAVLENLRPQNGSSERQIVELQQQMERLQTHHSRTRRLNDELYQSAVTEWLRARQQS